MTEKQYDIFISYRREGGAQYARILQLMLQQRGYRVFLDYDELTDGVFHESIKSAIKSAPIFMMVLSPGTLVRCKNEDDWVRQEVMLAMAEQKHIIPINPDNKFDGIPDDIPEEIKTAAGSHQHSDISFGQTLGVTVDFMIEKRIAPIVGVRTRDDHIDTDYDAAKESLSKMEVHNRFMKRVGILGVTLVVLIVLASVVMFLHHQKAKNDEEQAERGRVELRAELEKKHKEFGLYLSPDLTVKQMSTIDTILQNMTHVRSDTLWMSKFEFTVDQWYGIKNESFDESQWHMPMTNKSYGEIFMFLIELGNMTQINFDLPSVEDWEYAAHGGIDAEKTLYVGSNDPDSVAWYYGNSDGRIHPSDGRQGKGCNGLDLFDMNGNVGELCRTPYDTGTDDTRWTVCGGNYTSTADAVTISSRTGIDADAQSPTVGFRLVIRKTHK